LKTTTAAAAAAVNGHVLRIGFIQVCCAAGAPPCTLTSWAWLVAAAAHLLLLTLLLLLLLLCFFTHFALQARCAARASTILGLPGHGWWLGQ
jgi:hypothetical protein